jgi:hypothetical protein
MNDLSGDVLRRTRYLLTRSPCKESKIEPMDVVARKSGVDAWDDRRDQIVRIHRNI